MRTFVSVGLALLLSGLLVGTARAQVDPKSSSYHLTPRDLIRVTVFNEPDMTADRRIDANGRVSLPLIGTVDLNHCTVAEAQEKIRLAYVGMEIFVHPQVSVTVMEYLA